MIVDERPKNGFKNKKTPKIIEELFVVVVVFLFLSLEHGEID